MNLLAAVVLLFTFLECISATNRIKTVEVIEDLSEIFADGEIPLRVIDTSETEDLNVRADEDDPYRLPTSVVPRNYTVTLVLKENFGPEGVFTGSVRINLDIIESVQEITLQAQYLTIYEENIVLTCDDNNNVNLYNSLSNNSAYYKITIRSNEQLTAGSSCVLSISNYEGILADDMQGLYRSSYTNKDGETEWLASTHFEPVRTRRAFPCFDEPAFKATFQATISHPDDYTSISNTPLVSSDLDSTTGLRVNTFETTPVMPSYLNAYVISKFAYLKNSAYKSRVFARQEDIEDALYTLYITPHLLENLEAVTNFSYLASGIGKLDQVAIPDFSAGAMENWGLVTYRERNLLWNPDHSSNSYKQAIAAVIAHELTHSWFGNLVTCDWWSYTWLNEGFARYYQYFATGEVLPEWEMESQFVVAQLQAIFASDALDSIEAMTSPASSPSEISNKFSSISYSKGASVIRMMIYFMGEENYKTGIRQYLVDNAFSTAVPQNLFDALAPYANNLPEGRTFHEVMTTWTEQAGFPVITVSLDGNDAIVTQERFYLNTSYTSNSTWDIPLTYTISHSPDFENYETVWFPANASSITIENILHGGSGWVVFNLGEIGYYRVNYDDELWSQIQSALYSDDFGGIATINRAQIIDDIFNLARAGLVSYTRALNIVSYLESETEYYPWYSALTALSYLNRRIGKDETLGPLFQEFIANSLEKVLETVSFDENKDDDQIYTLKRALVLPWACRFQVADCVQKSQDAFNDLVQNDVNVNPNLRSVVYCNALRYANGTEEWEFLWNRYVETKLSTEQITILTALGCTRNEALLYGYLNKTITDNSYIRSQDVSTVYSAVYGNSYGVSVLFQFLKDNYKILPNYYSSWSSLFSSVAERFTTEEEIEELEQFLEENADDLANVASTIRSAISTAKTNLEWTNSINTELTAWFSSAFSGASSLTSGLITGVAAFVAVIALA